MYWKRDHDQCVCRSGSGGRSSPVRSCEIHREILFGGLVDFLADSEDTTTLVKTCREVVKRLSQHAG
jgi:hypothetical protein